MKRSRFFPAVCSCTKTADQLFQACLGIASTAAQKLGRGHSEKTFENFMIDKLYEARIPALRQQTYFSHIDGKTYPVGIVDIEVDQSVILELKANHNTITEDFKTQARRYLRSAREKYPQNELIAAVLLFYGLYTPFVGVLNGTKRFGAQAGLDVLAATLRTVGLLGGAWYFTQSGRGMEGALGGFAISAGLMALVALPLAGIDAAMENAKTLLKQFRDVGQPVVHIQHQGKAGGAFDLDDPRGAIDDRVAPVEGETVIRKALPNSFANTNLQEILEGIGRQKLVIAGFQTHMCVSATTRAALDLGYRNTLVADAIATRDLPGPGGGGVVAGAPVR